MRRQHRRVTRIAIWLGMLALLLAACPASAEGVELATNGGFEQVESSGLPTGWYVNSYRAQEGYSRYAVTDERAHSGRYSVLIENINQNDTRYITTVKVEPESLYRVSAYVWVERAEGGNGANLALEDVYAISECLLEPTGSWRYVEWYGETAPGQTEITLGVRVGGYSAESRGKAYFDDVSVVRVDALPDEVVASLWYDARQDASADETTDEKTQSVGLILLAGVAYLALAVLLMRSQQREPRELERLDRDRRGALNLTVWGVLLAALCARMVLAMNVRGYEVDVNCFTAWGSRMLAGGPAGFYAEGYFCDYPPAYLYVLWGKAALTQALSPMSEGFRLLILKLAPILSDLGAALLLYRVARRRLPAGLSVALTALFALNPAAIVTGSCWGQVDSLLALMLLVCALWAMERRWHLALPLFVLAVLTKPQALLCGLPALVWLLCSLIYHKEERALQLRRALCGAAASVAVAAAVALPFAARQSDWQWLLRLYQETLGSYQYATLNTANLMYLLGGNWSPLYAEAGGTVTVLPWWIPALSSLALIAWGGWTLRLALRKAEGLGPALRGLWSRLRGGDADGEATRRFAIAFVCLGVGAAFAVLCFLRPTFLLYGTVWMVFVNLVVLLPMLWERSAERLPLNLALVLIGTYVLGLKIHERYLYIGIALLFLACCLTRDRRLLWLAVGFSVTTFLNTAVVLDNCLVYGAAMGHLNSDTMPLNVALCVLNLLLAGLAYAVYTQGARASATISAEATAPAAENRYRADLLTPRDARLRMNGREWLTVLLVTAVYAVIAFFNLGSLKAPQNGWVSTGPEEQITFALDENDGFTFLYYGGVSYQNFTVAVSEDGENWSQEYACEMRQGLCYRWLYPVQSTLAAGEYAFSDMNPANVLRFEGRYLRLTSRSAGLLLYELIARDDAGQRVPMRIAAHTGVLDEALSLQKPAENLLDEQDTLEGEPSWFNGTYFDEIYHARTAYEHLHGQIPYETTHPPLGKLLMAVGVALFGMTPFGWRFMGALIGVLMVPLMYLLCKQLTRRRDLSTFGMLLLSLDLMHFTQTRLGTIDSFPVFFIMLSYLFMARYALSDFYTVTAAERQAGKARLFSRPFVGGLLTLLLCGVSMGLGIASKWIGVYSVAGLALLFAWAAYRQLRAAGEADALMSGDSVPQPGAEQGLRISTAAHFARKRLLINCGFCVLFFIVIPAVIYYLSYIPYLSPSGPVTLGRVIKAQESMLSYHSTPGLGMDHPFQSPWYQWPFLLKPMWYAQDAFEPAGYASTILCLGNPAVFYLGAFAMLALMALCVYRFLQRQPWPADAEGQTARRAAVVIVVGFLAQYLPWVLVPRSMYIYHYFASVPFIILATVYWAGRLNRPKLVRVLIIITLALALGMFVALYPFASGRLTSVGWLDFVKNHFVSRLYY